MALADVIKCDIDSIKQMSEHIEGAILNLDFGCTESFQYMRAFPVLLDLRSFSDGDDVPPAETLTANFLYHLAAKMDLKMEIFSLGDLSKTHETSHTKSKIKISVGAELTLCQISRIVEFSPSESHRCPKICQANLLSVSVILVGGSEPTDISSEVPGEWENRHSQERGIVKLEPMIGRHDILYVRRKTYINPTFIPLERERKRRIKKKTTARRPITNEHDPSPSTGTRPSEFNPVHPRIRLLVCLNTAKTYPNNLLGEGTICNYYL